MPDQNNGEKRTLGAFGITFFVIAFFVLMIPPTAVILTVCWALWP